MIEHMSSFSSSLHSTAAIKTQFKLFLNVFLMDKRDRVFKGTHATNVLGMEFRILMMMMILVHMFWMARILIFLDA